MGVNIHKILKILLIIAFILYKKMTYEQMLDLPISKLPCKTYNEIHGLYQDPDATIRSIMLGALVKAKEKKHLTGIAIIKAVIGKVD